MEGHVKVSYNSTCLAVQLLQTLGGNFTSSNYDHTFII